MYSLADQEPELNVHVHSLFQYVGTIKAMLSRQFAESRGEIHFPEIPGLVLEKLIQYLHYKVRYTNSSARIPEFQIEPEIALELLIAAGYLDC